MRPEVIGGLAVSGISVIFFLFALLTPEWVFRTRRLQNSWMGGMSIQAIRMTYVGFGVLILAFGILMATGLFDKLLDYLDKVSR
jgi:Mg2+/citrate symporter